MKEVIDLISSVSVLFASIAGLMAVNKWKLERFEKGKVDYFENYLKKVQELILNKNEVLSQDIEFEAIMLNDDDKEDKSVNVLAYEVKKIKMDDMEEKVNSAKMTVVEYCSYAGNRMMFNFNYFRSSFNVMNSCLHNLYFMGCEVKYGEVEKFPIDYIILDFLGYFEEKTEAKVKTKDYLDFFLIHKSFYAEINYLRYEDMFYDNREYYDDYFLNMLRVERKIIHSFFLVKFFSILKLSYLKYNAIGRVLCKSESKCVVIDIDGKLVKKEYMGKTIKEVESLNRKMLLLRYMKRFIS